MSQPADQSRLEARLRAEADAFSPEVPAGLADRVIAAVRRDPGGAADEPHRGRRWLWTAIPLAAGLMLAGWLELLRPEGPTSVGPLPPYVTLRVVHPPPEDDPADEPPVWQVATDRLLDREFDHLRHDTVEAGRFLLRCLPLDSLAGTLPTVGG